MAYILHILFHALIMYILFVSLYRLDEHMVAKVADFGFSRDIYTSDYYKLDHPALLPVKWLAPEALFDRTFTMKTDVVSAVPKVK